MSRRPISTCRRRPRPRRTADSPYALNDRLRDGRARSASASIEGAGGRDPRPRRQPLLRHPPRRHHALLRARTTRGMEVFAHIGGQPLGMAFDRDGNLLRLHRRHGPLPRHAATARSRSSPTRPTARLLSIIDDSRLRLADDLDIAPDGRIFFTEATIRYEMHDWPVDALESRGNGRIICYDPKHGNDAHGAAQPASSRTASACATTASRSCSPRPGAAASAATGSTARRRAQLEIVIDNLPGYPDNINRASDGNYWLALVGMRTPALDLALRMPGFRKRMARRVAPRRVAVSQHQHRLRDQVQRAGRGARDAVGPRRREPSDDHLDARAQGLSSISAASSTTASAATSSPAPTRTGRALRRPIGGSSMIGALRRAGRQLSRPRRSRRHRARRSTARCKPNQLLEDAGRSLTAPAPDNLAATADGLLCRQRQRVLR